MLKTLDRITIQWWFGHVVLLGLAVFVVAAAALFTPSDQVLTVFGQEIPVLCGWRTMTGIPCPGCGLTRSFTYMAHGQVMAAFQMNWLGPPMFAVCLGSIPWQAFRLWQGPRRRPTR